MAVSVQALRRYGKPVVFVLMAWPAVWLAYEWALAFQGLPNGLGFNPQESSNRFTGDWTLRMLLIALAITPCAKLLKSPKPVLFRRMAGLYAFFYVCLHILSYVWLDKYFAWGELVADVMKRIYITIGMAAFLLLIPLAVTSTSGWVRRLGARAWQKLHKLVYLIGVLGIIHFIMMRKGFQIEPLVYGALLAFLLAFRLPDYLKKRRKRTGRAAAAKA